MNKIALCLPFAAAAILAGCATEEPRGTPGPVTSSGGAVVASGSVPVVSYGATPVARAVVVPVVAVRPGSGTVESVTAVPHMGSASAGATVPGNASRLGIRMSDGTIQYVDYEARDIAVGARVELTPEGFIRRI